MIIQNVTFLYQTVFRILSKTIDYEIKLTDLRILFYEVNLCVKLIYYPKYDFQAKSKDHEI